jgi:hypothetical protein
MGISELLGWRAYPRVENVAPALEALVDLAQ